MTAETMLKWLLRGFGAATVTAIVPTFMPASWMAWCHEAVGLGGMPDGPVFVYLARSLSSFYAIFGGLLLAVSVDVRRNAMVIRYLGGVCIVAAVLVTLLDALLGLPWWWTAFEAPPLLPTGLAMILLSRKVGDGAEPATASVDDGGSTSVEVGNG